MPHAQSRKFYAAFIAFVAAAPLIVVSAEGTLAAGVWQRQLSASCSASTNFCAGLSGVIPSGHSVTLRHVSCSLLTQANPTGLGPVIISKMTTGGSLVHSDYFVPVLTGSTVAQSSFVASGPTLFTVEAGYRIGIGASTTVTGETAALQCLLSGDYN